MSEFIFNIGVLMLNRRSFAGLLTAIAAQRHTWNSVGQNTPSPRMCAGAWFYRRRIVVDRCNSLPAARGLQVTAVQNPLTSLKTMLPPLAEFLALRMADGFGWPLFLRERSLAKRAMTKVSALVYVAAARQTRERTFGALARNFRNHGERGVIKQDGFFWLSEEVFLEISPRC